VRLGGRDRDADAADILLRQPGGELRERLAPVRALPDPGAGAAVDERPDLAVALVGRRIDDAGIERVELHVAGAGPVVDVEHLLPRLAAVARAIDAAVAARRPQRALRGHEHHVGVARIDRDLADVLRALQA